MLEFFLSLIPFAFINMSNRDNLNFTVEDARKRSERFSREKPDRERERIKELSDNFYESVKSKIAYICDHTEKRSYYTYLYSEKIENSLEKEALIDLSYRLLNERFVVWISNDLKCVHELDKEQVGIKATFKCDNPDCKNKTYRGEILVEW